MTKYFNSNWNNEASIKEKISPLRRFYSELGLFEK